MGPQPLGRKGATMARTKWDILVDRAESFEAQAKEIRNMLEGFELTKLNGRGDGEPLRCSGCEVILETEAEFARHYEVPNEQFLNIGYCPIKMDRQID